MAIALAIAMPSSSSCLACWLPRKDGRFEFILHRFNGDSDYTHSLPFIIIQTSILLSLLLFGGLREGIVGFFVAYFRKVGGKFWTDFNRYVAMVLSRLLILWLANLFGSYYT